MQKTKIGISVGVLGAIMYLTGLISGYLAAFLVAGYILIVEENAWLKKTAVRTIVLMLAFSLISIVINFIPNLWRIVESLILIFASYVDFQLFDNFANFLGNILSVIKTVVFVALAFMSFKQMPKNFPVLDKIFDKVDD